MLDYSYIYPVHVSAVALSFSGFLLRLAGVVMNARWVRGKPARTLPHIVDSVLLVSAIGMLLAIPLNPLENQWLLAKLAALLIYIGLGAISLKPSTSRSLALVTGLLALTVFAFIISVAFSKNPGGFFSWI